MTSVLNDIFLSSDQDTNQFLVYAEIKSGSLIQPSETLLIKLIET